MSPAPALGNANVCGRRAEQGHPQVSCQVRAAVSSLSRAEQMSTLEALDSSSELVLRQA
jgi:hypothetical protein